MLTADKIRLINECLSYSREYPRTVFYGFITKDNEKMIVTGNPFVVKERILDGDRVYCKAHCGSLIL